MTKKIISVCGLILAFGSLFIQPVSLQVIMLFMSAMILWLFLDTKWVSLFILLLFSFIPKIGLKEVIKQSLGSTTILFLMMSFVVTYAFFKTSFMKRFTYYIMSRDIVKKNVFYFISGLWFVALLLGMFISPTVLFIVLLPLFQELLEVIGIQKEHPLSEMTFIGLIFICGISSGMTPISHVFPVIAMDIVEKYLQIGISYVSYLAVGSVIGMCCFILMIGFLSFIYQKHIHAFQYNYNMIAVSHGKLSKQEKFVLFVFACVVLLWVLPDVILLIQPSNSVIQYVKQLGIAFPPFLGTVLLLSIPVQGKPALEFEDAFKNGVHWPSIFICATTLFFGSLLTNPELMISTTISNYLQPLFMNKGELVFVFAVLFITLLQTNFSSNIVSAGFMTTIVTTIHQNGFRQFDLVSLSVLVGMFSAFAFASPSAMPSVAIVISKSYVPAKKMLLLGLLFACLCLFVGLVIGYPLAKTIF